MYLGSAFLLFFSVLAIPKISNLRSINHPEGFESHPRLQPSRFKSMDYKTFTADKDSKIWKVNNPEALIGIEGVM